MAQATTHPDAILHSPAPEDGSQTHAGEKEAPQAPGPDVAVTISRLNAAYDWTGPDDPDNPRNFPPSVRVFSAVALTALAMIATVAGSIYAPAQADAAARFGASRTAAVLPLSLYNLGLAFGPLVGAPLSEARGRRAVVLVAPPVFAAFLLGGSFCTSLAGFAACRFLAGVFASPLISNAPATMLDFTPARYRGVMLGAYYAVPSFGAGLGPLIGGYVVLRWGQSASESESGVGSGWAWTQWIAAALTAAAYVPVCFTRETYKRAILRRRAARLGLRAAASLSLSSSFRRGSPGRALRHLATTLVQRPLHMLLTEPIVALVSAYNGFLFGLLYTFVVSVPWVFSHYYRWAPASLPLAYLGIMLGTLSAAVPLVAIDLRYYQPRLDAWRRRQRRTHPLHPEHEHEQDDPLPPETRLLPAMIGSLALPPCLFAVGWSAQLGAPWAVPMVFQALVMLSSLLVYAGANLFMLDAYGPLYGASASGAMMLSRYTLGAVFPLFALRMYEGLGAGWATSVLGFVTVAMAPIPWCFRIYGERLRRRSKYESST